MRDTVNVSRAQSWFAVVLFATGHWPYGLIMIGLFFSLFIPGGTGGDIVKGYYLLKEAPVGRKTSAALSIVMDRLLGLLGIAILAGTVTAYRWKWLTSDPVTAKSLYAKHVGT